MRRGARFSRWSVVAACAIVVTGASGCVPFNSSSRFGVNHSFNTSQIGPSSGLMRAAGFKWARVFSWWGHMEDQPDPATGAHRWTANLTSLDQEIDALSSRGFSILLTLGTTTPRWAMNPSPTRKCTNPDDFHGNYPDGGAPLGSVTLPGGRVVHPFADYASAMAARYKDRVAAWEIWNEPSAGPCSFPGTASEYEQNVLLPGYDAIKAVVPSAYMVSPAIELSPHAAQSDNDNWITYTKGTKRFLWRPFDAISVHEYHTVADIKATMDAAHDYHRCTEDGHCVDKYWLAEFGFNEDGDCAQYVGCQHGDPGADIQQIFTHCESQSDCVRAMYWNADENPANPGSLGLLDDNDAPRSKYFAAKSYIQAREATNPGVLHWSYKGTIPGMTCVAFNETADTHTWNDNYLCSVDDLGLRFADSGPIAGQHCVQINEPSDPDTWNDNYLCSTVDYGLQWSFGGPIPHKTCVLVNEPSDPDAWSDNYLCSSMG